MARLPEGWVVSPKAIISESRRHLMSQATAPFLAANYDASAAMQIAIWSEEYKGQGFTFAADSASVNALVSTYVDNVDSGRWLADPGKAVAEAILNDGNQTQGYLVPEPASVAIFGVGMLALAANRRKKASA